MSQLVRWRMYEIQDAREGSKCSIARVYILGVVGHVGLDGVTA